MNDLLSWGTLTLLEGLMATTNLVGLILASVTAAESHMDFEAVRIIGRNGARRMKAAGNRRDEIIKLFVHGLLLLVGVLVMASPAERIPREAYTVEAIEVAAIAVSIGLIFGSIRNLYDRRRLWAMPSEKLTAKLGEHFGEVEDRLKHENDAQHEPKTTMEVHESTRHQPAVAQDDEPKRVQEPT
jgi:hypothetical protein